MSIPEVGKKIRVTVPSTTANLGPGFDCLGAALDLYNEFIFTRIEGGGERFDLITARIFSNEEEVKRMTHQLISEKLLVLYKEKVNKKITETSYEKYIELAYKKND